MQESLPPQLTMSAYTSLQDELRNNPRKWLITGGAGFIGSHLTETLLNLGQQVVALDNLATGKRRAGDIEIGPASCKRDCLRLRQPGTRCGRPGVRRALCER